MYYKIIRAFAVSLIAMSMIAFAGCEERGTNVPGISTLDGGAPWPTADHAFSPELRWLLSNNIEQLPGWVYIPRVTAPPPLGESRPVPLLILLAPQGANKFFFAQHGLQELLREMIADGTIHPMVVACPSNDPAFGGFMYAGGRNFENNPTPPSGNNDAIFGTQLVDWLRTVTNFAILESRQKTGIGGFGMGAYGAFRAALLSDTVYGSISVTDGPLDFDGGGPQPGNGLIDLFHDALNEQGLLGGTLQDFDSSSAWPISNLFIGAAYAFSPADTVIFDSNTNSNVGQLPFYRIDSAYGFDDTISTYIDGFNGPRAQKFDYLLPFTADGNVYPDIWNNYWLTENLENLIDSSTNKLNGVNLWFATTTEAKLNYYQQTQSWISTLTSPPYVYNVIEKQYQGIPGNPASGDQYVYDLLREMLIFHSNSFGN